MSGRPRSTATGFGAGASGGDEGTGCATAVAVSATMVRTSAATIDTSAPGRGGLFGWRPQCRRGRSEPQRPDLGQGLQDDGQRHLGLAGAPLFENDGNLRHAETAPREDVAQLDLEAVPLGRDARKVEPAESGDPEALEPGSEVAEVGAEHGAGVQVATAAD